MKSRAKSIRSAWLFVACGLASLTIISVVNYNFMLNHFFQHGAYLLDTGLLGSLIHEPRIWLDLPAAVAGDHLQSWYATHFSPTFYLLGLPSLLMPTNFLYYSAIIFAGISTSVATPVPLILWQLHQLGWMRCGRAGLAGLIFVGPLALALSGPVMLAVHYPHFELLFAPLGGLFFLFAAQKRFIAADIAFAVCVLTREDFAFHLFGILFMWVAFQMWFMRKSISELTPWLAYLVAAAIAGSAILLTQHLFFPGDALTRVYLGSPIYSHVTLQFLGERIDAIATGRLDLLVCLLPIVALSIVLRDPRYLLGYLACAPWLIFSLLAKSEPAGTLALYYGFPLVLAAIWPMLVLLLSMEEPQRSVLFCSRVYQGQVAIVVFAASLAGFVGSTTVYLWRTGFRAVVSEMEPVSAELQAAGIAFQRILAAGLLDRERIGVDHAVASLLPRAVHNRQLVDARNLRQFRAIAFYATSLSSDQTIEGLIDAGYSRSLRVGASSLYVAARPSVDRQALARMLQPLEKDVRLSQQSYLMTRMRPGEAGVQRSTFIATKENVDGLVIFGPYVKLSVGSYRVEHMISSIDCTQSGADGRFEVAVWSEFGKVSLAKRSVATKDVVTGESGCSASLGIDFTIDGDQIAQLVETPLWHFGSGRYAVTDVKITRLGVRDD